MSARRLDGRAVRRKSVFKGIAVVPGIAIGQVHLKFTRSHSFSDRTLAANELAAELERLQEAVRMGKEQLMVSRSKVAREIGELEATIFDTHIALLEDRSFLGKIRLEIERDLKPAEVVVSEIVEGYYQALSMVADANIRERAADIRDVGRRLLDNLATLAGDDSEIAHSDHTGDVIFTRDLLPSDIATLEHQHVAGVVSETGNDRGHCAVMLRAMGLPSVMGGRGPGRKFKRWRPGYC